MTQEEKAKRYDEALIRCSRLWESDMITRENYEYIFPEIKESKDENIKKALIIYHSSTGSTHVLDKFTSKQICDWLKKQGEKKPTEWHREDEQNLNVCLGYIPDEFLRRWLTDIIHVKYDKPVEKVEPKFNVGDWVVSPNGVYWHIDKIINNRYEVTSNTGESSNWNLDTNIYHKFTIQDAKDGDVIYSRHNIESFEWIGIFKSLDKENKKVFFYGFWHDMAKSFSVCRNEAFVLYDDFSPATKEQRELLFQKMKEAGYEWDSYSKKVINNR